MNFIFELSTRYLTSERSEGVSHDRVDHSKIKFISTRGHVISSISPVSICFSVSAIVTCFSKLKGWKWSQESPNVTDNFSLHLGHVQPLFWVRWLRFLTPDPSLSWPCRCPSGAKKKSSGVEYIRKLRRTKITLCFQFFVMFVLFLPLQIP